MFTTLRRKRATTSTLRPPPARSVSMTVGLAFLLLAAVSGSVWIVDRRRRPQQRLQRAIAAGAVLRLFTPVALLYGHGPTWRFDAAISHRDLGFRRFLQLQASR
jgi:hypothetical protein